MDAKAAKLKIEIGPKILGDTNTRFFLKIRDGVDFVTESVSGPGPRKISPRSNLIRNTTPPLRQISLLLPFSFFLLGGNATGFSLCVESRTNGNPSSDRQQQQHSPNYSCAAAARVGEKSNTLCRMPIGLVMVLTARVSLWSAADSEICTNVTSLFDS